MVAAERQGSYAEMSRLAMPPPSKKAVRWRGPAVTGDCPRNYLAPRGVESLWPRPNHDRPRHSFPKGCSLEAPMRIRQTIQLYSDDAPRHRESSRPGSAIRLSATVVFGTVVCPA